MKAASKQKQKLGPLQRKWIKLLRSGEYRQGRGALRRGDEHCCLGVACIAIGISPVSDVGDYGALSDYARRTIGLRGPRGETLGGERLTELNDTDCLSFAEIAEFIEADPKRVFEAVR